MMINILSAKNTKQVIKFFLEKTVFAIFTLFFSLNTYALVSLESTLLGDFSDKFRKEKDPLDYIFKREENLSGLESRAYKEAIASYRGFYEEGKNLLNQCKLPYEVRYESLWHKSQVKRALGATMQYVALDLLVRSIPLYAKYFEFQEVEYKKMTEGLVDSYCSNNLSIISKNSLKKNLLFRFQNESDFRLPSTDGNPLFSENLTVLQTSKQSMEQEFKVAIEMFKSTCSWSGGSEDFGLMTPLMKHPSLFSFLIRQFEGYTLEWVSASNSIVKKRTKSVLNVWCENLICRRSVPELFFNSVYKMIGSDNLSEDLKKLYCEEFLTLDYDIKSTKDDHLIKEMKARTFESENFLSSYLVSLITGVPDFILRAKKFDELEDVFRSNVDSSWTIWAKNQLEKIDRDVFYEEALTFEVVKNDKFVKPFDNRFDLYFDINLGEFDRLVETRGKVKVDFSFSIPTQTIHYIRRELMSLDPRDTVSKENFYKRVRVQLEGHIEKLKKALIIIPWRGDFANLLAEELVEQVAKKENKAFDEMRDKNVVLSLHIFYGPFALKTIKHMRDVENQKN